MKEAFLDKKYEKFTVYCHCCNHECTSFCIFDSFFYWATQVVRHAEEEEKKNAWETE